MLLYSLYWLFVHWHCWVLFWSLGFCPHCCNTNLHSRIVGSILHYFVRLALINTNHVVTTTPGTITLSNLLWCKSYIAPGSRRGCIYIPVKKAHMFIEVWSWMNYNSNWGGASDTMEDFWAQIIGNSELHIFILHGGKSVYLNTCTSPLTS